MPQSDEGPSSSVVRQARGNIFRSSPVLTRGGTKLHTVSISREADPSPNHAIIHRIRSRYLISSSVAHGQLLAVLNHDHLSSTTMEHSRPVASLLSGRTSVWRYWDKHRHGTWMGILEYRFPCSYRSERVSSIQETHPIGYRRDTVHARSEQ